MARKKEKRFPFGLLFLFLLLLVIVVLVVLRILKPKNNIVTEPLSTVSTETPTYADIYIDTSLVGTVMPGDVYYVVPKAAGEIREIFVQQGDHVSEGDPICTIDNQKQIDAARISMDAAQVQVTTLTESVALARTNLDRMAALRQTGDVSAQSYEQTKNAYDQAVSGLEGAKLQYEGAKLQYDTQVEFATVTAPVSGTVESTDMSLNAIASQTTPLAVISSLDVAKLEFSVTDRLLEALYIGSKIEVERQGQTYPAHVTKISRLPNQQTGLYPVEAAFDGLQTMARGTAVKVVFVSEKAENVLTVSTDSIYYDGGKSYVYTLSYDDEDEEQEEGVLISENNVAGTVHKKEVETGLSDVGRTQIVSGITQEDVVIRTWTSQLYEGAKVQARVTEDK